MQQISWRAPDELVVRVRHAAAGSGSSVNAWISRVLDAATNPELAGSDVDRLRERLARAGLLAEPSSLAPAERPDPAEVAKARAKAGQGTSLSQLVIDGRD